MPTLTGPNLSTPPARVHYAAHYWFNDYLLGYSYIFQLLSSCGISEQEIEDGVALGEARLAAYRSLRARYGDPAYGSWPETAPSEDAYILERADDQGVKWCQPAPGVREMWRKAAAVIRKYEGGM